MSQASPEATRYRIVSRNRWAQYLFMAAPKQVWIGALQATTTELSSYGVRTVDVIAPDDLLIPAFEYHYMDGDVLVSQIPKDYIGATSEVDLSRADASPWLDRLPVIQEFRCSAVAEGGLSFPWGGRTREPAPPCP